MNQRKREEGFTLVEVLITLVILGVSLLAIAGLTATSISNNSYGGSMTEAVTFAQDKLEELRAARWDSIVDGMNTDQAIGPTRVGYTRTWTANTAGNIKTIAITIRWRNKTDHAVTLQSFIAR